MHVHAEAVLEVGPMAAILVSEHSRSWVTVVRE